MSEMTNEQKFFSIYVEELKKEITKDNSSYAYGIDQAEEVGLRMVRALKEKAPTLVIP